MNISRFFSNPFVYTDKACDFIPGVSTVTNLGDLFLKYAIIPLLEKTPLRSTYFFNNGRIGQFRQHINLKKTPRCLVALIPVIGNIFLGVLAINKHRINHLTKDEAIQKVAKNSAIFSQLGPDLINDWDIALAAIKKDKKAFRQTGNTLSRKCRFWIEALRTNPEVAQILADQEKKDIALVARFYHDRKLLNLVEPQDPVKIEGEAKDKEPKILSADMHKDVLLQILDYAPDDLINVSQTDKFLNQIVFEKKRKEWDKELQSIYSLVDKAITTHDSGPANKPKRVLDPEIRSDLKNIVLPKTLGDLTLTNLVTTENGLKRELIKVLSRLPTSFLVNLDGSAKKELKTFRDLFYVTSLLQDTNDVSAWIGKRLTGGLYDLKADLS